MKRRVLIFSFVFVWLLFVPLSAQWAKTYGGSKSDTASQILPTKDGGFILVGTTSSFGAGDPDAWVVKIDKDGNIEWQKAFGYSGPDNAVAVQQTSDEGYLIAGGSSLGGNISRFWVFKLTSQGNVDWQKAYNLVGDQCYMSFWVTSMQLTSDGGCIVAGSFGERCGWSSEIWILKLDSKGAIEWQKWGGIKGTSSMQIYYNAAYSIGQTTDGGYIVTCSARAYSDAPLASVGGLWILKLTAQGGIEWQKLLGVDDLNYGAPSEIQPTSEGGYILAGGTTSSQQGKYDVIVVKLDAVGTITWQKKLGLGLDGYTKASLLRTGSSGYVLTCHIEEGIWLARFDLNGNIQWQKAYGWTGDEWPGHLAITPDGGYIIAGNTPSLGAGDFDLFVVRTDSGGNIGSSCGLIKNSALVPSDSNIAIRDTNEALHDSNANVAITTALSQDTNATVYELCPTITHPPRIVLSTNFLRFDAEFGGSVPPSQSFGVKNGAFGTLQWTGEETAPWLSCAPSAGTEAGDVTVTVDPSKAYIGENRATILVSSPTATNSPQTVTISFAVRSKPGEKSPFGSFDTPSGGSLLSGSVPVTGWTLDDKKVLKVEIKRNADITDPPAAIGPDGFVFIGDACFVEGARPDIERLYPNLPFKSRAGWGYMLLTNFLPNQGNGTFTLHAFAYDESGFKTELAFYGGKVITCDNAHAVKPFGAIDTPAQGGDASGQAYVNYGWVLTPLPKTVPKDGSTISVWVDGVKVGDLKTAPNVYNQYRVDVSSAFPGLNNSSGPVGTYYLDTTKYANGVHTIHWIATDDQGAADGIGSRYFNSVNAGTTVRSNQNRQFTGLDKNAFYESVPDLPVSFEPRKVRQGFIRRENPEVIQPDHFGTIRIEIEEVEGLELDLGRGKAYQGYLVVGREHRPLPIGSTLDQDKGVFSWMPGPGFLGTYDLIFLRDDGFGVKRKIPVKVIIRPKV